MKRLQELIGVAELFPFTVFYSHSVCYKLYAPPSFLSTKKFQQSQLCHNSNPKTIST
jgi:hypothetical protein